MFLEFLRRGPPAVQVACKLVYDSGTRLVSCEALRPLAQRGVRGRSSAGKDALCVRDCERRAVESSLGY